MGIALNYLIFGLLNLLLNSYSDVKTHKINSKHNYIMLGLTFALVMLTNTSIWVILALLGFSILIAASSKKMFAAGDLGAFSWIFLGFGVINPILVPVFGLLLALIVAGSLVVRKLTKKTGVIAGYPLITLAYLLTLAIPFLS